MEESHNSDLYVESRPLLSKSRQDSQSKINLIICMITLFLSSTGFAIIGPSLWPYLNDVGASKAFLGVTVSAYSLGQVVGAPVFGIWSNRRTCKEALTASLIFIIVGSISYSACFDKWIILVSRFVQGFGSGNAAVLQSYVAATTTTDDRTKVLANLNLVGTMGFILGPAIGAVLSFVKFTLWDGRVKVYPYSSPGYFCGILGIVALCLILFVFREKRMPKPINESEEKQKIRVDSTTPFWFYVIVFLIIFSFFNVFTNLAVYETLATPITMDNYKWSVQQNSLLWVGISSISLVAFFCMSALNKYLSDAILLFFGMVLQIIGLAFIIDIHDKTALWRFLLGTGLISFGFPISQVELISIYSKVLGTKKQGTMMGFLTAGGASARMVGPIWATNVYEHSHMYVVFLILTGMISLGLLIMAILYGSRLIPKRISEVQEDEREELERESLLRND